MASITTSVEAIKAAVETHGVSEMSRLSGVPYMTIKSLIERDFRPKTIDVMEKLETAATTLKGQAA